MTYGGNTSNVIDRARVQRALAADGRCICCHPHRGENGYGRNVRWIDGKPVKRKGKAVK